jgi:periplasmic protein TonB
MTARAISLEREDDRGEFLRWALAGLVMLAAHAGVAAAWMLLHRPDLGPSGAPVVLVELAPLPSAPAENPLDVPAEQEMVQAPPEPDVQPPQPEEEKVEPPPPPPVPVPEVVTSVVPPPPEKPVEKKVEDKPAPPKPQKKPPAPRTAVRASAPAPAAAPAAPQLGLTAQASAAQASWRDLLVAHLQRHKRYPADAQARRDQGTVLLSFTMDRNGHVLSRSITRGSGVSELDQEVLAMIQRAQPLPAFPPAMPQPRMSLTVPIRFSLR